MAARAQPRLGRRWRGAIVGALCGLFAWVVAQQPFFNGLEEWLQDSGFAYRGARAMETKVVIVGIDDATLAAFPKPLAGFSPELADVVTYLKARGASAIGLDLMVPETLDAYDVGHGLDGKAFGRAAAMAGNVVVPMRIGDAGKPVFPLRTWRTGSPSALVEVSEDVDHIVRRQQLTGMVDGEPYDGLPLALLQTAGLADTDRAGMLYVDHHLVPLDARGRLRINFVGPPGTVSHVAFKDVLADARKAKMTTTVDQRGRPADFEGAVVIVGVTARSMGDYHATPYANGTVFAPWRSGPRLMSGPELHANVVATLADGAFITTPSAFASLPWVLLFGGILGWAFSRITMSQGLALGFAHHFGWKLIVWAAFWLASRRIEVSSMLLTGMLAYTVTFAMRWRSLRAGMFGVVKGDLLARILEEEPRHPGLGGEERVVSVLFSDVRGFTAWSRHHSPSEVVGLLNAYFAAMVPLIEAEGGTVDKYIGDGIMAIFGAPDDLPEHATRSVRAAAAMVTQAHELMLTWSNHDFADFRIGVGVATGPAVVGMVGSRRRLDYTAIGDTVNAAARIESANKALGSEILIAERTRNAAAPEVLEAVGCAKSSEIAAAHGVAEGLVVYRVGPRNSSARETINTERST